MAEYDWTRPYRTWEATLKRQDDEEGAAHGFPIGFPGDDGVHMYCTDPNDPTVLMPAGAKGEICIGGVGLARGYLRRPELTGRDGVVFMPQRPYMASGTLRQLWWLKGSSIKSSRKEDNLARDFDRSYDMHVKDRIVSSLCKSFEYVCDTRAQCLTG